MNMLHKQIKNKHVIDDMDVFCNKKFIQHLQKASVLKCYDATNLPDIRTEEFMLCGFSVT